MSRFGQMRDWLLPALIHLDPMGAMAYYQAVAKDEASTKAPVTPPRRALVSDLLKGTAVFDLVDVPQPARVGP